MRIAAITNSRIPSTTANSIQALKACQGMVLNGHQVMIVAPREVQPMSKEALLNHYGLMIEPEINYVPSLRLLRRYDLIFHAQAAARKFQAELIYTWLPQSAVLGLRNHYPVVLEMHADLTGTLGKRWLRGFWRLPGHKRMTVTTRALRERLEDSAGFSFPDHSILVIPNAVDIERYQDLPTPREARSRLNLRQQMTLGFTGHVYPGRGAQLLISLAKRMPDLQILWVGGISESVEYWRGVIKQAGLTNLVLTGFVDNSKLPLYQAAADILLMPYGRSISASSGQDIAEVINPMKMFEYMATSRPIISADLPAIREILNEDNSVLCEPDNLEAWILAIKGLLANDSLRIRLGARAREDVREFSWKIRAQRILDGFV